MHSPPIPKRPFQFTILRLLLAMAVVACICAICAEAVSSYIPPERPITAKDAARIKPGMTRREVTTLLGGPHYYSIATHTLRWYFEYPTTPGSKNDRMLVIFDADERVVSTQHGDLNMHSN